MKSNTYLKIGAALLLAGHIIEATFSFASPQAIEQLSTPLVTLYVAAVLVGAVCVMYSFWLDRK